MPNQQDLIDLISGKRRGIAASVIRGCLSCLTPLYRLGVGWRNRKFDRAARDRRSSLIHHADIPVISVGNLTTGGTGKTPLVIWIARFLSERQRRVVLISRGYGADRSADGSEKNDEAIEMEHRLPGVPHLQDPNRSLMSQIAVEEFKAQIIILDDAFQHRQLHRDLNVVLIDATLPFGYGRLLPRGLLREPLDSLHRADLVILTRCDMITETDRHRILATLERESEGRPIAQTRTTISGLIQSTGNQTPIDQLHGIPVFFFCGIGNPENFRQTLENIGLDVRGSHIFPDHHRFSRSDLEQLGHEVAACGAEAVVCTHKDLVKIGTNTIGRQPLYAIQIDIEFVAGEDEFKHQLERLATLASNDD